LVFINSLNGNIDVDILTNNPLINKVVHAGSSDIVEHILK